MLENKKRKGQIGATLTWVVGFLIIFFIMFLFVSASLVIAGKRKIPVIGVENKIEIAEKKEQNLISTKILFSLLETKTENVKLKNMILNWDILQPPVSENKERAREEIVQELKKILVLYGNCEYIFHVDAIKYKIEETNILPVSSDPGELQYFVPYYNSLLEKASLIKIPKGDRQIEIKFYLEC